MQVDLDLCSSTPNCIYIYLILPIHNDIPIVEKHQLRFNMVVADGEFVM